MKRDPITKVNLHWVADEKATRDFRAAGLSLGLEPNVEVHRASVRDGALKVLLGIIPGQGAHLSISHSWHNGNPGRYPTWDEIAAAREHFLPMDREFVMHLPKASEYVAVHRTTFHLHEAAPDGVVEFQGQRFEMALCLDPEGEVVLEPNSLLPLAVLRPWTPEGLSPPGGTVGDTPPTEGATDATDHQDPAQDGR